MCVIWAAVSKTSFRLVRIIFYEKYDVIPVWWIDLWKKKWFTKSIEEFYKLFNYFCHYHCMFFNYTIIIDRLLDIIYVIYLTTKKYNKNNLSNKHY